MTPRTWIAPFLAAVSLLDMIRPASAGDNTSPAAPPARPPAVTWTLGDVTAIALENHPLVKQSEADLAAAVARKGQAQAGWYPSVDLSTGVSRARSYSVQSDGSSTTSNQFLRGDLNWMLYDFGRTGASVGRADAVAAISREGAATTREEVVFVAKVAFYNVLRAENTLEFQRTNLANREALLRQAQAFYEAGVRAKIDFVRAEANLYDARAQVGQSENDLRVARITLLQRIGVDGPADFGLSGQLVETDLAGTMKDWVAEADANRPELRALAEKERSTAESLRLAKAGYLPYIAGAAGLGYGSDSTPLQQNYSMSITLNYPLFSGFQTREQVKEAEASISSVRHEIAEARRRVRLEVERSAFSVQEAKERLVARRKQRDAAEENLRLATARYEVGAGDIIEISDAQTQKISADTETVLTAFDYAVSQASLLRAMGR